MSSTFREPVSDDARGARTNFITSTAPTFANPAWKKDRVGAIGWAHSNSTQAEVLAAPHNAHQTLPYDSERRKHPFNTGIGDTGATEKAKYWGGLTRPPPLGVSLSSAPSSAVTSTSTVRND
eukprot:m.37862 g.37862  ORF g.37862 m.37862 type:complete len:122 (-) comp5472_c0_seq2:116-481(-)